jgi:hypothetical protein
MTGARRLGNRSAPATTGRTRKVVNGYGDRVVNVFSRCDRLGSTSAEAPMADNEPLRAAKAARQLGIPTKELLRLVYGRRIGYVMLNGMAHIPSDAIKQYQA